MALVVLVNTAELADVRKELTEAGVTEDPTSGVVVATTPLNGGALKRESAVYGPDGAKVDLRLRDIGKAPADKLPAAL